MIWVLSHLRDTAGTRITCQLFEKLGYETQLVSPSDLHLVARPGHLGTSWDGEAPQLIYTRLGSSAPQRAIYGLEHLELMGWNTVNRSSALARCRDKWRSLALMADAGLPVPKTILLGRREKLDAALEELGAPPYVVKIPVSSKGTGVALAESVRSLRSIVDVFGVEGNDVLVQEFIADSKGSDLRVMVLAGRAFLAVRRKAVGDEFRSNVYLGGADLEAELTPEMAAIAEKCAEVHGLQVAGVDLLECSDGYRIAEVNGSPGLSGPYNRAPKELEDAFAEALAEWTGK